MKSIRVVAAIISQNHQILATQRNYGEFNGGWEFPGGKIEAHETPKQALVREIKEELHCDIIVHDYLLTVEYDYPNFHLSMDCFQCTLSGDFELSVHQDARWLNRDSLDTLSWLPADITILNYLKSATFNWR